MLGYIIERKSEVPHILRVVDSVMTEQSPPQVGMVATVRNRRGILTSVNPFDGPDGRLHHVEVEFNDGEQPREEALLWEREPYRRLLPPGALPDPTGAGPMAPEDLQAMIRACRWQARTPFIDPDGQGPMDRLPISSPFHGAVQVEDYQLVPLLKALSMPRVSLLIADDVGLGKTIEAGLVLSELLLRRRIRKVLVLTPASLKVQWRDELWEKFSLFFEMVDRESTLKLRRQIGMDANPWRSFSRILASYHYLKQPDVLEQFRSASQQEGLQAHLPWDLLIVDEAHNLTPSPFGNESDLCKMLRTIAPYFEHKLFLTATPHNGHTRSFTGLLELLDPVRFSQTEELGPAARERVEEVVIRRLKREVNGHSERKRFSERRKPQSLLLALSPAERRLSEAFQALRGGIRRVIAKERKQRRLAGNFAIEILGKRLLSCPYAMAESWQRCREGMAEESGVDDHEVLTAQKSLEGDHSDDRESNSREAAAAQTVGAWMAPFKAPLEEEIAELEGALAGLGLAEVEDSTIPKADCRMDAMLRLVAERLRDDNGQWREDERLVLFTEYKTTLDYLVRRLRSQMKEEGVILPLYGGMPEAEREVVKRAFNDPSSAVRILVATDAASEGLNLQESARYILHFDVPWNPSRLEQRNGRLDRHGQARDVTVWHFVSEEDNDLRFLDMVVHKVDTIREDLGSTGDVFDELTCRRLIEGADLEEVRQELDLRVAAARRQTDLPRDAQHALTAAEATHPAQDLNHIAKELDFDGEALRETLDSAMALGVGRPRVEEPDAEGFCGLVHPIPGSWNGLVDEHLRIGNERGVTGALPRVTFDPKHYVIEVNGRPVFRPRPQTLLLHLGHPLLQKSLSVLSRQRFPGASGTSASRWTLRHGPVPDGADCLLQLTVEELAINELRESFHHWVRTYRIPVRRGRLGEPLPHQPARELRLPSRTVPTSRQDEVEELWIEIEPDIKRFVKERGQALQPLLEEQLERDRKRAATEAAERYQGRQGEVSSLIEGLSLSRIEREIDSLKRRRQQGVLFDQDNHLQQLEQSIELKEQELKNRRSRYEEVRRQLTRERERILEHVIPRRYRLRGNVQVLPIAMEFVLPEGGGQ